MARRPRKTGGARKTGTKSKAASKPLGLLERLARGPVICAEGYLFEFERRGYLQAGAYVPEIVLERPDLVEALHREFVHAGSDVVEAFTYYAHRAKLRMVGREGDLARINRTALRIAKKVARSTGTLLAGDICNTSIYDPNESKSHKQVRRIFEEQIEWAVEAGVDFIVAETYSFGGEALLALEAIRQSGRPAVVTLAIPRDGTTREGWNVADACRRLEEGGAAVVGLNCARGPATTMPLLREIRAAVKCHVAALPVPYRTTAAEPVFQSLTDP
ncbi:MAG TPA: homocysteine S-methyltransferase family protein, partial [Methylomirabilota bacterium]|nr:homocysteine S-methyltransferase family protein [Methylomirabilota bacterium]